MSLEPIGWNGIDWWCSKCAKWIHRGSALFALETEVLLEVTDQTSLHTLSIAPARGALLEKSRHAFGRIFGSDIERQLSHQHFHCRFERQVFG
jgi:hypothetical protein